MRFTEEQIIGILREQDAGAKVADLARKYAVSEATLSIWQAKYGGMDISEAKRSKALEDENTNLKKLSVNQMLECRFSFRSDPFDLKFSLRIDPCFDLDPVCHGGERWSDQYGPFGYYPTLGVSRSSADPRDFPSNETVSQYDPQIFARRHS